MLNTRDLVMKINYLSDYNTSLYIDGQ